MLNKIRSLCFKNAVKIDKTLARMAKKNREETNIFSNRDVGRIELKHGKEKFARR